MNPTTKLFITNLEDFDIGIIKIPYHVEIDTSVYTSKLFFGTWVVR